MVAPSLAPLRGPQCAEPVKAELSRYLVSGARGLQRLGGASGERSLG